MSNTNTITADALQEYTDDKRLQIYKMVLDACSHLYSKGKLQEDKFENLTPIFADLTRNDPLFMAHLTAWAAKGNSKDMQVLTTFFNALSDADGTPLFEGASRNKPNLRKVSSALLQNMPPKMALRVLELCHRRFSVRDVLNNARHFPKQFQKAFKKYIKYREQNPEMLHGIKNTGLAPRMRRIYTLSHVSPSDDAVTILNWKQKDGRAPDGSSKLPDFQNMSSSEIARALDGLKMSPMVALSTIPSDKITASVATALLNNCSGNQSVILYRWFAKNGFLDVDSIAKLFKQKAAKATTAVDRIDTLTRDASEEDKKMMAQIRSTRRKKSAGLSKLGKIFVHIDASGSMHEAIEFAKERACIIAECVDSPEENFGWGYFNGSGHRLSTPEAFTKEDFFQALYGVRDGGYTDCMALYADAREFGADVDLYISDQGHNVGTINVKIRNFHEQHPELPRPRAAVIVDFGDDRRCSATERWKLRDGLQRAEIPVAILRPEALTESAMVDQAVQAAIKGEMAVIDEIMATELPSLPGWYGSL